VTPKLIPLPLNQEGKDTALPLAPPVAHKGSMASVLRSLRRFLAALLIAPHVSALFVVALIAGAIRLRSRSSHRGLSTQMERE
jgi:hypothetical protein